MFFFIKIYIFTLKLKTHPFDLTQNHYLKLFSRYV